MRFRGARGLGSVLPAALQRAQSPCEEPPLRLTLTVADISIGATMVYAAPAEYPLAGCKEIGRWYAALAELPAWKKALPS